MILAAIHIGREGFCRSPFMLARKASLGGGGLCDRMALGLGTYIPCKAAAGRARGAALALRNANARGSFAETKLWLEKVFQSGAGFAPGSVRAASPGRTGSRP